ncbi:four helix bundle protein [bacterium]|nr:four helix bundle protein [bacterium]MBU1957383.1 four helix bundle protein [bacterium]
MNQNLPIFKSALDLCVYIDTIVKNQEKYHKYGIGSELRASTREMFYFVSKANSNKENRVLLLQKLIEKCEETKAILYLAKEIKAFKSFKQFEHGSMLTVNVCRQAQAWLNSARVSK